MVQSLDMAAEAGTTKDALASHVLADGEIKRLHDHLHELKDQSITDGLHVIGRPLTDEQVRNTTALMLSDQDRKTVLAAAGVRGPRSRGSQPRGCPGVGGRRAAWQDNPGAVFLQSELAELRQLQTSQKPMSER